MTQSNGLSGLWMGCYVNTFHKLSIKMEEGRAVCLCCFLELLVQGGLFSFCKNIFVCKPKPVHFDVKILSAYGRTERRTKEDETTSWYCLITSLVALSKPKSCYIFSDASPICRLWAFNYTPLYKRLWGFFFLFSEWSEIHFWGIKKDL